MVTYHRRNIRPSDTPTPLTYQSRCGPLDSTFPYMFATGSLSARLLILAPGTTRVERFWVGLHANLTYNALWLPTAIMAAVAASPLMNIWWSLAIGAGTAGLSILGSWWKARTTLAAAHGVNARLNAGGSESGDIDLLESTYNKLRELDTTRLTPAEYEHRWGAIWTELEQLPTTTPEDRR